MFFHRGEVLERWSWTVCVRETDSLRVESIVTVTTWARISMVLEAALRLGEALGQETLVLSDAAEM